MRTRHCAVLLAAGGSERLGQPKQELTHNGEPLIRRAARLLAETGPQRLLVVVNTEEMATHLHGIPAEIIVNGAWQSGIASSVRLAAQALDGQRGPTLFATVDQCRLAAHHLEALLDAWPGEDDPAGRDVVSRYDSRNFGIPALVSPEMLARSGGLTGDRGFGQIWRARPAGIIPVDARELGFDLDTPAQLATAIRHGWIDGVTPARPDKPRKPIGLRELKQERVRARVIAEAVSLFAANGFEEVTVDEVAAAAGISRRTLFRHFPTKGDIVFAWTETMTAALRDTLARRDPGEPLVPTLRRAFVAAVAAIPSGTPQTVALLRLIEHSPLLRQHAMLQYAAWEKNIMSAWQGQSQGPSVDPAGGHASGEPASLLAGRVLARGGVATFRSALEEWLRHEGDLPFSSLLDEAFDFQRRLFGPD